MKKLALTAYPILEGGINGSGGSSYLHHFISFVIIWQCSSFRKNIKIQLYTLLHTGAKEEEASGNCLFERV